MSMPYVYVVRLHYVYICLNALYVYALCVCLVCLYPGAPGSVKLFMPYAYALCALCVCLMYALCVCPMCLVRMPYVCLMRMPYVQVRPGASNCSFYMASGLCKFGEGCKFNHPPEKVLLFFLGFRV